MLPRLGDLHSPEFDFTDASENNDIMKQCCYHYSDLTTAPEFEGKDSRDVCLDSNRAHSQALAGNPVSSTHQNPERLGYRTWSAKHLNCMGFRMSDTTLFRAISFTLLKGKKKGTGGSATLRTFSRVTELKLQLRTGFMACFYYHHPTPI